MGREYSELSSYDFECLIRDLLQAEWNEHIEIFSPGPDGGIDLRLLRSNGKDVYIQCKHSPNKNYSDLRSTVKQEAAKIRGKLHGEYWFATSANLTAKNKSEICDEFGRDILSESRILWRGDIDNLLQRHPRVEQANYKLYITSQAVLQRILNSKAFSRNEAFLQRAKDRARIFVQTSAFSEARSILNNMHTCLITGEPGIGKTTLAEMLILSMIDEGYECIVIEENISEAEELFHSNTKQVFYYDDFLGQVSLAEKLGKNEDSRLVRLIKRLENEPDHKLILTTREYLFRQALRTYERLGDRALQLKKYTLDLQSYNRLHRAHMLYNHVYYSKLPRSAAQSLLTQKRYKAIIDHTNYSPRLIEFIVNLVESGLESSAQSSFADQALLALSNPSDLWRHAYEEQLSPHARDLLLVLASLGSAEIGQLEAALRAYYFAITGRADPTLRVRKVLEEVDGVFVRTDARMHTPDILVQLANPSFRDYINGYIRENLYLLDNILDSTVFVEQIEAVFEWGWDERNLDLSDSEYALKRAKTKHLLPKMIERLADLITMPRTLKPSEINSPFDFRHQKLLATQRLYLYLELSRLAGNQPSGENLKKVISYVLNAWNDSRSPDRGLKEAAILIVRVIHEDFSSNEGLAPIADYLANLYENQLSHPEDFQFLDEYYSIVDPGREDDIRESFVSFVPRYVDTLLTGDPEHTERGLNGLLEAAESFEVDIDEQIGELQVAVEDYNDEQQRKSRGQQAAIKATGLTLEEIYRERSAAEALDHEVDGLFQTLVEGRDDQ